MSEDDDFFFPNKDTPQLPVENVDEKIDAIENQLPANIDTSGNANLEAPLEMGNISSNHPFAGLRTVMQQLSNLIVDSQMAQDAGEDDAPEWARVQVNALKEMRMLLQTLLPQWDEFNNKMKDDREEWIDHLMTFNLDFILQHLGENFIETYMDAWDKWLASNEWEAPSPIEVIE